MLPIPDENICIAKVIATRQALELPPRIFPQKNSLVPLQEGQFFLFVLQSYIHCLLQIYIK